MMEINDIYEFLKDLQCNNNREWFNVNRQRYESTKKDFEGVAQELISCLSMHDANINFLNPKDCIYRIYRDVRFSNNKSPYKTNYGTFIVPGGRKSGNAGYYLHIEPGNSFLGGGVYHPEKNILRIIRNEIYAFPDEFLKIIEKRSFVEVFPKLFEDDKLKMGPKDFDKEFKHIDLLKYKSYLASRNISDDELFSGNLFNIIEDSFRELKPFVSFLNKAIRLSKEEH